jgi:excisionase family DNA binding protein
MNDMPTSRFLRKKQLAALLGVSHRTLDGWIQDGLIPYIAPTSRLYLFDLAQVMEVLETRFGFTPGQSAKRPHVKEPAASGETAGCHANPSKSEALHSEVRE